MKELTRLHASFLRSQLNSLDLRGVSIKRTPEVRSAAFFADRRTLAYIGITDISVAIVASSDLSRTEAPPISTLLIAPTLEGSGLLADDESGRLWSDSFWVCEERRFKLVKPTRPIPVDGIDLTIDDRRDPVLDKIVAVNHRLYELTDDKQWTKTVLERAGVRVPRGIFLTFRHPNVRRAVEDFLATIPEGGEVVLKGNRGAQGQQVLMFDFSDNDVEDVRNVAHDVVYGGEDVILEERIQPPPLPQLEKMFEGRAVDYNFRVLTSLDRAHSRAIDAEIRFQPMSNFGVNISLEAQAVRCNILNNSRLVSEINKVAEAATNAVCREVLAEGEKTIGFAGVDLILDQNRQVYVLEVNAGKAGGFGTLCRLDKKPLDSIRDILIPSALPYLDEAFQRRTDIDPTRLRRIAAKELDLWNLYTMLIRGRKYLQAEDIMIQISHLKGPSVNTDEATVAGALAWLGNKLGRFEIAEQFIDNTAKDLLPHPSNIRYMRLEAIREYIEKRKRRLL